MLNYTWRMEGLEVNKGIIIHNLSTLQALGDDHSPTCPYAHLPLSHLPQATLAHLYYCPDCTCQLCNDRDMVVLSMVKV